MVEEKPQAILAGLERPTCRALLAQLQEIAPHLLFGKLIRGALVMGRQLPYRSGVNPLRSLGQTSQGHILNHPRP